MFTWHQFISFDRAGSLTSRSALLAKQWQRDDRGSVAIMFALTSLVVVSLVGAAVDYGRAQMARERLQRAVDTAVLAAARVWQIENDLALAEQKAIQYFDGNKPSDVAASITSFTPDLAENTITMTAQGTVTTPFLSLIRNDVLQFTTRGQAMIANGGNAGTDLEISLMLDVTGSMAGSKLADLKDAAKDLIDIVVWSDQSEHTSRVAIAPFSQAVNAGSVLGPQVAYNPSSSLKFYTGSSRRPSQTTYYRTNTYCLSERTGSEAFTDAAPTGSNKIPRAYQTSNSSSACLPQAEIMPLTSDKGSLKGLIDDLQASGSTAGHLGTAWAWYLLSPNWASVLPAGSVPQAYSRLTEVTDKGVVALKKIAVLMTDGDYNYQYCNSSTGNTAGASIYDGSAATCTSPNGTSSQQAAALCTAMKDAGITVYTVGFGLGNSGSQVNLLRNCATEPGMFYNASTGDELRAAFRHIATSIAAPILSR